VADTACADDLRDALEALDQAVRKLLGNEYSDSAQPDIEYFKESCVVPFRKFFVDAIQGIEGISPAEMADSPAVPRKDLPEVTEETAQALHHLLMMLKYTRDPRIASRITSNPETFVLGALLGRAVVQVFVLPIIAAAMAVQPHQVGQSHGGKAPKRSPGIWQRVCALVEANPAIAATEAWKSFPEDEHRHEAEGLIYRVWEIGKRGKRIEKLVELDDRTGKERSITYHAFRGYVSEAKKELRKEPRAAE
jgi:hypothetical protein